MRRALPALCLAVVAMSGLAPVPAAAAATAPLEGLPRYDHVFVLVEENESIDKTYGATSPAVYLKSLVKTGVFADHYYGVQHNSLDNYIAMVSGQNPQALTQGDCLSLNLFTCAHLQVAGSTSADRNLADQLDDKGVTWKGYMDGNTLPCQHASYSPAATPDTWQGNGGTPAAAGVNYADRHNPFLYFPDIMDNEATRCVPHVRPFTQLATDLTFGTVPQFGFITPDTCHDGHDNPCSGSSVGGLQAADTWLSTHLPTLLTYLGSHNGLLLIITDEGNFPSDTTGCCTGNPLGAAGVGGGRVGLVGLGPGVKVGQTVPTPYDHASLLRTLESLFGISENLNNAGTAAAMVDLFGSSTPASGPTSPGGSSNASNSGGGQLPPTAAAAFTAVPALVALVLALFGLGTMLVLAKVGRDR
ncbi:MAG TPA: alkaline phosphatase family protein [Candidatus Dormibacteraeota bacterium]